MNRWGAVLALALAYGLPEAGAQSSEDQGSGPQAARQQARRAREAGQTDRARALLEAAARAHPNEPAVHADLGDSLRDAGRLPAAIAAYERSLELAPNEATPRYNLAYCLREVGRHDDAVAAYDRYLRQRPNDPDALYGLALTEEARGRPVAAANQYEAYAAAETRPANQRWVAAAKEKAVRLRSEAAGDTGGRSAGGERSAGGSGSAGAEASTPRASVAATQAAKAEASPASARAAGIDEASRALESGRYNDALNRLEDVKSPYQRLAIEAGARLGLGDAPAAVRAYRAALERLSLERAPAAAEPTLWFGLAEALRASGDKAAASAAFARVIEHPAAPPALAEAARARR